MKYRELAVAAASIFAVTMAFACKPGTLEHDILFSPGSSTLENWQIRSLVEWYTIRKAGNDATKGIEYVGVFANAVRGNSSSARLARDRLSNVVRVIETSDPDHPRIHRRIFKMDPDSPTVPVTADIVGLEIQPACAKTRSCCPYSTE